MYACIIKCKHIYIYIYIYSYKHINIHSHTHREFPRNSESTSLSKDDLSREVALTPIGSFREIQSQQVLARIRSKDNLSREVGRHGEAASRTQTSRISEGRSPSLYIYIYI